MRLLKIVAFSAWLGELSLYTLRDRAAILQANAAAAIVVTLCFNYFVAFAMAIAIVFVTTGAMHYSGDERLAFVVRLHGLLSISSALGAGVALLFGEITFNRAVWAVRIVMPVVLAYFAAALILIGKTKPLSVIILVVAALAIYAKAAMFQEQNAVRVSNGGPIDQFWIASSSLRQRVRPAHCRPGRPHPQRLLSGSLRFKHIRLLQGCNGCDAGAC